MIVPALIVLFTIIIAIGIHSYFFQNRLKTNDDPNSHVQHKLTLFDILDLHCPILSYRCKSVNKDWNKHASHPSSTTTFNVLEYFTKKFFLPVDRFSTNYNCKPTLHDCISLTVLRELYHLLLYLINMLFNWINSIMLKLLHYNCDETTRSEITDIVICNNADCQYKYCPETRYWFNCCNYNDCIYWKNLSDNKFIKKCKHFDISQNAI